MGIKKVIRRFQLLTTADDSRSNIINNNFLMQSYKKIYEIMDTSSEEDELIIELGSAGGVAKSYNSRIITSDIRTAKGVDMTFSALEIPFQDATVDQIWLKDVLHHLTDPYKFFVEAKRVLKSGGTLSIAEPYWGPIAKIIYKYFHPEIYRKSQIEKNIFTHEGNQALAEVLLKANTSQFEEALSELTEIRRELVNGPAWLLSGGATMSTPLPSKFLMRIRKLEEKIPKLRWFWSLNIVVVYQKGERG